jgi:membrane protease YdiL (CAAX protease family)
MSIPPPSYAHPGPPPEHPERPEGAPERSRRSGLPPWRWWMGLVGVAMGLAIPIVLGVIAGIGVAISGGDAGDLPSGVLIALTFFQDLGFIAAALFVARMARRPSARDFGLVTTPFWRAVGIVVGVYVGFYVVTGIWAALLNLDDQSDLPDELGADTSTAALVAVIVLVCVMAPVAEEFLFRGLLFTSLRASAGLWPAALVTGAVFGAIHAGSSPVGFLVPLAVLGLGLCLIYAWTRSLYPCVALHAINNAIAFGVTQDWTWEIPLLIVGGTGVSLLIVVGLGRALGRGGLGRLSTA